MRTGRNSDGARGAEDPGPRRLVLRTEARVRDLVRDLALAGPLEAAPQLAPVRVVRDAEPGRDLLLARRDLESLAHDPQGGGLPELGADDGRERLLGRGEREREPAEPDPLERPLDRPLDGDRVVLVNGPAPARRLGEREPLAPLRMPCGIMPSPLS